MPEQLKPCPFCGNKDYFLSGGNDPRGGDYSIICSNKTCRSSSGKFSHYDECLAAWNRRYGENQISREPIGSIC